MNPIVDILEFGQKEYLDALCKTHQRHNILALRRAVGDERFLLLLDIFAGLYVRFPTAQNAVTLAYDIKLAILWQDVKTKSRKDAKAWNEAETRFIRLANRLGYNYDRAKERAKRTLALMKESREWIKDLQTWDANRQKEPV